MSDFIKEVDEEYRRDRMAALWTRYQIPIAILIVGIIAGAGFWRYWSDAKVTAAEKVNTRYEAAQGLAKDGKAAEAEAAFLAIAKDGPTGYAALARFSAANVLAKNDAEGAAKAYDAIAGDDSLTQSLRDTARFRGALLRIDIDDPKAFEQRYGRFTQDAFTYRNSMRELVALADLKRQDFDAAGKLFDEIIADSETPGALRGRAQAFRQIVNAGPATPMATQPKPGTVTPLGQGAAPPTPSTTPPAPTNTGTPKPPSPNAPAANVAPAAPALPLGAPKPPPLRPTAPQ